MEFGQIHHTEYYVNDINISNSFWNWFMPYLGYKKCSEWGDGVSWRHKSGTYIVFVQVEEDFKSSNNSRHGSGLNHIAFMGGSLSDLDELQERLESQSIKILKRKNEYLCLEDPNGFAVEVYAKANN